MPGPIQPIPPEQTLAEIAERAKGLIAAEKPPLFDVNVSRRNSSGVPQQMASFQNATLEHINNPVRWLPMLCGGGEYILNVRHPDLPDRIGGPLPANFDKTMPGMEPKQIDPRIARGPHWQGPTLVGGAYTEPAPAAPMGAFAGATVMPWGTSAPSTTTGYGLPTTGVAAPAVDRERELSQQLADMKAQLARTEAEARARTELENERRASEARIRDAENKAEQRARDADRQIAELRASIAQAAATQPKVDPSTGWKEMLAIAMPFIQQFLTSQHEMRVLMLKMNEETSRRQLEAAEKQHQGQMEMLRAISAQKPGMSDEMKLLIETLRADRSNNGAEAMGAFMTRQLEAMGMMSKMSLDLVHTAADMGGNDEHPAIGAIREAASAIKVMMTGTRESAQRMLPKPKPVAGQPSQQQLTPQQVAQLRQQQAAQQQAAARAAQQRANAAAAAAQAGRVTVPQAAPVPQPVPVAPPPAEPSPQLMQAPDGRLVTHFQVLKEGIIALKDPSEVVDYFTQLKNNDELSLRAALDQHGGSPWDLLKSELGMGFIASNEGYFSSLGELIDARGITEGWWPDDGDESEESGEAEESGEDTARAADVLVPEPALTIVPAPAPAEPAPS